MVVNPDRTELEPAGGVQRTADVARTDGRGEGVADVVGPGDRLIVVGEALHRAALAAGR